MKEQVNENMTQGQKDGLLFRTTFLTRCLKEGKLIKTGEKLQLKDMKPKTIFALDNTYYEMALSSNHYCKFYDCVSREFYTTKTSKIGEVLAWKN